MESSTGGRRVRTGCLTCRTRKVKCDETKPWCLRCRDSNRDCGGYPPVPPRAKRRDAGKPRSKSSLDTSLELYNWSGAQTLGDELTLPGQPQEISFGVIPHFRDVIAAQFDSVPDRIFWVRLMLQVGATEVAVRHAMSALCAVYVYAERNQLTPPVSVAEEVKGEMFASCVQQYNKSIRELRRRWEHMADGNECLHLICSTIFVRIEQLCGRSTETLIHLQKGFRFLQDRLFNPETKCGPFLNTETVHAFVMPLFRRTLCHVISQGLAPSSVCTPKAYLFPSLSSSQEPYETISEAFSNLSVIHDIILVAFARVTEQDRIARDTVFEQPEGQEPSDTYDQEKVSDYLELFRRRFLPLEASILQDSELTPTLKTEYFLCCLRMYYLVSRIRHSRVCNLTESVYDQMDESFSELLNLGMELYVKMSSPKDAQSSRRTYPIRFQPGILFPLWFTATKCRQRSIRRLAVELLSRWPQLEEGWNPFVTAKVARRVIEEEDPPALDSKSADGIRPPEEDRVLASRFVTYHDDFGELKMVVFMIKRSKIPGEEWNMMRIII